MENWTITALAAAVGILLFAVGYLLGERRGRAAEKIEFKPKPEKIYDTLAGEPTPNYPIPNAPRGQPPPQPRTTPGVRIVSPREAIFHEMQKRDGLVDRPPERMPPAVAAEFLTEAATQKDKEKSNGYNRQEG
jgi:hypothetical protein